MINQTNLFSGRSLIIATKHQKEQVIGKKLEQQLGVKIVVPSDYDTDLLGTFSGEIERKQDSLSTLRIKCQMAMDKYKVDLVVASEGSFGPHPSLFFVHADEELMMLIDKKNNLEIVVRELTTETNFNGMDVNSEKELTDFAQKALFPSHALILRNSKESNQKILKGIKNWEDLYSAFKLIEKEFGKVYVETDMRAMYNPTRMEIIGKLTEKLIEKINTLCPSCKTPGFGEKNFVAGLPCEICGTATRSALILQVSCLKCSYLLEHHYPNGKQQEDAMFCDFCNP